MRKTKIVCTIGPASESEETITAMCEAGMNVARLNFSHGTHAAHEKMIAAIKRVRKRLGLPIAIVLDTKGPEYRIKAFEKGEVTLTDGAAFTLTAEEVVGNETVVSVSYDNLANELEKGDMVLLNNGLITLQVEETAPPHVHCRVIHGGVLSDRKSMSFPGKVLQQEYLSEQDKKDLLFDTEPES